MNSAQPITSPAGADRVQAIKAEMTEGAEAGTAFAEAVRSRIADLNARVVIEAGGGGVAESAVLLNAVRHRVTALDPRRLEPHRGLAGLFDSRGKRLKAFRTAYASAADAAASASAELMERAAAMERRDKALEDLWSETREAVADLDAHIAAGRAWLADRASETTALVPPEAAAAFEEPPLQRPADDTSSAATSETDAAEAPAAPGADLAEGLPAEPEPSPTAEITALPHPIEARLEALSALRASTVSRLPLIRAAQNATCATPAMLRGARDQIEAWQADWRDALGLGGKRPRKVRPDGARLSASREALENALTTAEATIARAQARLEELTPRTRSAPPALAA